MTTENIEFLADKFKGEISKPQTEKLKRELEVVSDEKFDNINDVKVKRSLITLLLSAFLGLFGAGSFYLGYFKRGIIKICFNVILPLAIGLVFLFWLAPTYFDYHTQGDIVSSTLSPINKVVTPSLSKYSEAYKNLNEQINNVEKKNEELKVFTEYVTKDEFKDNSNELFNCINNIFNEEFIDGLNSLTQLGGLLDADDYAEFIEKLDEATALISQDSVGAVNGIVEFKQRLSVLLDTNAIENSLIAVNTLKAWSFNSTAEELKAITDIVDDFLLNMTPDKKSEDLISAILAVSENSLIKNYTAEMFILKNNLEVFAANFESLLQDLKAKYLALSGKEYITEEESNQAVNGELTFEEVLNSVKASLNEIENSELINDLTVVLDGLSSKISTETTVRLTNSIKAIENYQKATTDKITLPDNENQVIVAEFVKELDTRTGIAYEALVAINHEKASEDDNTPNGYLQEMSFPIVVMFEQKPIFLSVDEDVGNAGNNVVLVKFVENKLHYHSILAEALTAIDNTKAEANINNMNTLVDKINAVVRLENKASTYAYDWKVDSEIMKYLFITLLAIDGTIILAYWIGEVFKDRTKCYNFNYDNIIKRLAG